MSNELLRAAQDKAAAARQDADAARLEYNVAEGAAWMAELRVRQNPEDELAARRAEIARHKAEEAEVEWAEWDIIAWELEEQVRLLEEEISLVMWGAIRI